MSHAWGAVRFKDGDVKYYEYNGTCDVVISHIYDTMKEVNENWSNHDWMKCDCGKEEEVEIYTDYGYGWTSPGKACRNCLSINGDIENKIKDFNSSEDLPKWLKEAQDGRD